MEPFLPSSRLAEDVQRRLGNSILYYRGLPMYSRYYGNTSVRLYDLVEYYKYGQDAPSAITVEYTDPLLEDRAPRLGYVNYPNVGAHFITRSTMRDQRMGLPVESLSSTTVSYLDTTYVFHQAFIDMLMNKYPTISQAWQVTKDKRKFKFAFSKNYAINSNMCIFYQDRMIGSLEKGDDGWYVDYLPSIRHVKFYVRNLSERFALQIKEFNPNAIE